MWMSAKGIKTATIQLDPPELGSLHVKVSINQDQANVSFTVQNASVREALDQNALR
jgi:flagellar hook-length control protein FliK